MNIFKAEITSDFTNKVSDQLPPALDIFWIRFGREALIFTDDETPGDNFARAFQIYSFPKDVLQTELYTVAQKERLFQRHNPAIPVIYDAGRYLLVRLEPSLIESIKRKNESCYNFVPLESRLTFFEEPNLADFRREPIPFIQTLVDQLNPDNLKETLEFLTSFHTRFWTSSQYAEAASRIENLLNKMEYDVHSQPFETSGERSLNVIANKQGSGTGERKVVLVTAHLDSIGEEDGDSVPAPGADDNGSGCAGLIEIARIFQTHHSEHDLRFIFFGGEEKGFLGSKRYVRCLSQAERDRVKAVVNMDMIGFLNSDSQKVFIEGGRISQAVINGLLEAAATYTNLSSIRTSILHMMGKSDHVPFIDERIPAVLTNEGTDIAEARINPRIHSPNDTIDTLNYDLALEILRMNVAYIAKEIT